MEIHISDQTKINEGKYSFNSSPKKLEDHSLQYNLKNQVDDLLDYSSKNSNLRNPLDMYDRLNRVDSVK